LRGIEEVRPDRFVLQNLLARQPHDLVRKNQPFVGVEHVIVRYQGAAIPRGLVVHGCDAHFLGEIAFAAAFELRDDRFEAAARVEHVVDQQEFILGR